MSEYPSWITESLFKRTWSSAQSNNVARLCEVKAIAIHYGEGPGQDAYQIKDTFQKGLNEDLTSIQQGHPFVGSHFIVDETQILATAPKMSYIFFHVGDKKYNKANPNYLNQNSALFVRGHGANYYAIGIEHCHPDISGRFTPAVLKNSHKLVRWLLSVYGEKTMIARHYDFTGKACPLYYSPAIRNLNTTKNCQPEESTELKERELKERRWILLHDYYRQSDENAIPEGI